MAVPLLVDLLAGLTDSLSKPYIAQICRGLRLGQLLVEYLMSVKKSNTRVSRAVSSRQQMECDPFLARGPAAFPLVILSLCGDGGMAALVPASICGVGCGLNEGGGQPFWDWGSCIRVSCGLILMEPCWVALGLSVGIFTYAGCIHFPPLENSAFSTRRGRAITPYMALSTTVPTLASSECVDSRYLWWQALSWVSSEPCGFQWLSFL